MTRLPRLALLCVAALATSTLPSDVHACSQPALNVGRVLGMPSDQRVPPRPLPENAAMLASNAPADTPSFRAGGVELVRIADVDSEALEFVDLREAMTAPTDTNPPEAVTLVGYETEPAGAGCAGLQRMFFERFPEDETTVTYALYFGNTEAEARASTAPTQLLVYRSDLARTDRQGIYWYAEAPPADWVRVVTLDQGGNAGPSSDPFYVGASGCSAAPSPGTGLALALVALAIRRRRRAQPR
ncbi:MAG: MYXO-CTERM sorting domain-containing protein [Myxococcota bacterium]